MLHLHFPNPERPEWWTEHTDLVGPLGDREPETVTFITVAQNRAIAIKT
jgi:hypothetical protein